MLKRTKAAQAILMTMALAFVMGLAGTTTVKADDHRGGDRGRPRVEHDDWRDHERHARHWHARAVPTEVYAPPVVYAAPPEPAGISLIFPLRIR